MEVSGKKMVVTTVEVSGKKMVVTTVGIRCSKGKGVCVVCLSPRPPLGLTYPRLYADDVHSGCKPGAPRVPQRAKLPDTQITAPDGLKTQVTRKAPRRLSGRGA